MPRRLLILIIIVITHACACGSRGRQKSASPASAQAGQVTEENFNTLDENLKAFLSSNAKLLTKWPFKEWGYKLVDDALVECEKPEGESIKGEALKAFLQLDMVNHYSPALNISRHDWVESALRSNVLYTYCGTLDVSDSLNCYIYTAEDYTQIGYYDAFALLVKDNKATGSIPLAGEGHGMWDSIESNRVSRNSFVIASFAIDVIDENGNNPGSYYFIRVNNDGSLTGSEASESDFNRPTWNDN